MVKNTTHPLIAWVGGTTLGAQAPPKSYTLSLEAISPWWYSFINGLRWELQEKNKGKKSSENGKENCLM